MPEIGIREFKQQASKILKQVREEGASYTITYQGEPCGVLIPYSDRASKGKRRSKRPKPTSLRGILRGTPEFTWEEFMDEKKEWDRHVDRLEQELQEAGNGEKEDNGGTRAS